MLLHLSCGNRNETNDWIMCWSVKCYLNDVFEILTSSSLFVNIVSLLPRINPLPVLWMYVICSVRLPYTQKLFPKSHLQRRLIEQCVYKLWTIRNSLSSFYLCSNYLVAPLHRLVKMQHFLQRGCQLLFGVC